MNADGQIANYDLSHPMHGQKSVTNMRQIPDGSFK